jgi:hypothetical protein
MNERRTEVGLGVLRSSDYAIGLHFCAVRQRRDEPRRSVDVDDRDAVCPRKRAVASASSSES